MKRLSLREGIIRKSVFLLLLGTFGCSGEKIDEDIGIKVQKTYYYSRLIYVITDKRNNVKCYSMHERIDCVALDKIKDVPALPTRHR